MSNQRHDKSKSGRPGSFIWFGLFVIVLLLILAIGSILLILNNPINTVIADFDRSTDAESVAIIAIEAATSNAISSATLVFTVLGALMAGLSISAAYITYAANIKLGILDAKTEELDMQITKYDARIRAETHLRHILNGQRYRAAGQYKYALMEFEYGLSSSDGECRLSANYNTGLLFVDKYSESKNPTDFEKAEEYLKKSTEFEKQIDKIIVCDSYASLGCLYGLRITYEPNSVFRDEYLDRSIKLINEAYQIFELAIYQKNLAITYAQKSDIESACKCIDKAMQHEEMEKGLFYEKQFKENKKEFLKTLFKVEELECLKGTAETIIENIIGKNKLDIAVDDVIGEAKNGRVDS